MRTWCKICKSITILRRTAIYLISIGIGSTLAAVYFHSCLTLTVISKSGTKSRFRYLIIYFYGDIISSTTVVISYCQLISTRSHPFSRGRCPNPISKIIKIRLHSSLYVSKTYQSFAGISPRTTFYQLFNPCRSNEVISSC